MAEVMRHRSSHIDETVYDRESGELQVTFTDGRTYKYDGVPRGTYTEFITAPSRGRAFAALIRDRFDGEEM
jgi:hypothetical protein